MAVQVWVQLTVLLAQVVERLLKVHQVAQLVMVMLAVTVIERPRMRLILAVVVVVLARLAVIQLTALFMRVEQVARVLTLGHLGQPQL